MRTWGLNQETGHSQRAIGFKPYHLFKSIKWSFYSGNVQIKIPEFIKTSTSRNSVHPLLHIDTYSKKKKCLVSTLKAYIQTTRNRRLDTENLFWTFKRPHHKTTSQTISKWIKLMFKLLRHSAHDICLPQPQSKS